MKQIKFNLLAIIGLMVAVGTVAFTAPKKEITNEVNHTLAIQTWYFTGSELSEAKTSALYSAELENSCDSSDELPCEIQFEAANFMIPVSNTPLQNYLDSHPDGESVKDDAVAVRSIQ